MHQRSAIRRPVLDALVIVGVGTVGLFGLIGPVLFFGAGAERISAAAVVLVVLQAVVLWWRRDRPLAVLAVTVVVLLVARAAGDENAASFLGMHVAAYSVGAYATRRESLLALAGIGAAAVLDMAVTAWVLTAPLGDAAALSPTGLLVVVAGVVGRYVAVRRAYLDTLVAYAHQVERERDEQARQAVQNERHRIARELHDQVAHHLGVVALHTQAARRWLPRDQERTEAALQSAEGAARAALTTMPAILHALRSEDAAADMAPICTLDAIDDLVAKLTSDDLAIDLRITGERRPLPVAVDVTAYRIVQEALTNVIKHAGAAHVDVELRFGGDTLEVAVTDDGRGPAATPADGSRLGLIGMRERVELVQGELDVGPGAEAGFAVRASLPTAGADR